MLLHYRNFSTKLIVAEIDGIVYTEQWRPVEESPVTYQISTFGRLKKVGRWSVGKPIKWLPEKILAAVKDQKGYLRFHLKIDGKKRNRYSHRLVAIAFIPKVEGKPCVNHKTAIKTKNHFSQLEWCTDAENNEHAKALGIYEGANSKIPKEQRRFIKENFFTIGREKLAEMFGLTDDYILSVANVKVNGTNQRKKATPHHKKIINIETGDTLPSAQALSETTGLSIKNINRQLNGERYCYIPYRYVGEEGKAKLAPVKPKKEKPPKKERPTKKVYIPHPLERRKMVMYNLAGNELKTFSSSTEAAIYVNSNPDTFRRAIRRSPNSFTKGFVFRYATPLDQ